MGARLKEDAGRSATNGGKGPHKTDDSSRESSPRRDPPDSNNRRRDRYALLFGVQLTDVEAGPYVLPTYAWNETVIKDILGPEVKGISDVVVINPGECLVFSGQHSKDQGFTQAEAVAHAGEIHDSHGLWIGRRVRMRCVPRSLKDARADLRAAKEYLRQYTYDRMARSPGRRPGEAHPETPRQQTSPWDSDRGRGMVRRSDRYQAHQYLRRQSREDEKLAWRCAEGSPDQAAWQFQHAQEPETCSGLGSGRGRRGRGHPLGRGRPDEVPQEFRNLFHPNLSEFQSAQEEQSDSPPEYTLDDSEDESDEIVGYDLTNGRHTTKADQDRREQRDQGLAY